MRRAQESVALSVCGDVNVVFPHLDVSERGIEVVAQGFVVVAGNVEDLHAAPGAAQQFLHDGVVARGPIHAPLQRPEIDDVAEQKYLFALVPLEEFEQALRLAGTRAQMDIGQEQRADALHCGVCPIVSSIIGKRRLG